MNKNTKESILAILIIISAFILGYLAGDYSGYNRGISEGVTISKGDKWDCSYSDLTGFMMCDRTPKYK